MLLQDIISFTIVPAGPTYYVMHGRCSINVIKWVNKHERTIAFCQSEKGLVYWYCPFSLDTYFLSTEWSRILTVQWLNTGKWKWTCSKPRWLEASRVLPGGRQSSSKGRRQPFKHAQLPHLDFRRRVHTPVTGARRNAFSKVSPNHNASSSPLSDRKGPFSPRDFLREQTTGNGTATLLLNVNYLHEKFDKYNF